jgi:peptidoglycan/xylan/chitin deacetylase (PgdA/CDA1 family)
MNRIPVLMYHHIADDREVTPAQFEGHLKYLAAKGYRTPGLPEFYDILTGAKKTADKLIVLTFDDGYADNWVCAWPLLKKYGFRAVVFVATAKLRGTGEGLSPTLAEGAMPPQTWQGERLPARFLSWAELKVMTGSGVFEAGSHTHTHRDFVRTSAYKDIGEELETSSRLIEEHTGIKPISIAWPWGEHEKSWGTRVKKAGYKLAFTIVTGVSKPGDDPLYIKRIRVSKGALNWLKSRLALHRTPLISEIHEKIYGLDIRIKNKLRRAGR